MRARHGGDEFAVLLVDTDAAAAVACAERIRDAAKQSRLADYPDVTITFSLGIAQAAPALETFADWVSAADGALYAKTRNADRIPFAMSDI